ncbi:MAG: flagellar FlbD family protein [Solirubrobacterales bacterium]
MIQVTRLNGEKIIINLELIETVEETPDTVITLTNGKKFVVRERAEYLKSEVIRFRKLTCSNLKK